MLFIQLLDGQLAFLPFRQPYMSGLLCIVDLHGISVLVYTISVDLSVNANRIDEIFFFKWGWLWCYGNAFRGVGKWRGVMV